MDQWMNQLCPHEISGCPRGIDNALQHCRHQTTTTQKYELFERRSADTIYLSPYSDLRGAIIR